jgi:hypothetical protein
MMRSLTQDGVVDEPVDEPGVPPVLPMPTVKLSHVL